MLLRNETMGPCEGVNGPYASRQKRCRFPPDFRDMRKPRLHIYSFTTGQERSVLLDSGVAAPRTCLFSETRGSSGTVAANGCKVRAALAASTAPGQAAQALVACT